MIKKINMLSLSVVLTVIVFFATTAVQKIFVDYEPTVKVLAANEDIQANRPLDKFMFKTVEVPVNLVMNLKIIKKPEDVAGRYSTENIHKGEILLGQAIALKNEIKIIEIQPGREKISVKIRAPENAVSYQVKTGDKVNLYCTGASELVKRTCTNKKIFPADVLNLPNGSYSTVMVLENTPILGVFDQEGKLLSDIQRDASIDSIVFSVSHDDCMLINNLKGQGTFDISGLPY